MVELLFQRDSYLREFEARVVRVEDGKVYLDRTAFHPYPHGGLDSDTGYLEVGGRRVRVSRAVYEDGDVAHVVEDASPFKPGVEVRGVIDWERRYRMMKLHTFSHILAAVLYKEYGALVTGGHIAPDKARDDFDLSMVSDWKKALTEAFEKSREIAKRCIEVKVYWLPREEALKIEGLVKLANKLPPSVEVLRIVEIPGVDIQADGGPHVRNTCEIGDVELVGLESKGRKKRRIYYRLREE
ncbi:alanine--tRNA ligase-related protein [Stetteria hydrogenophila]